ncbi:MAG: (4Fe-4S)-binding protein [Bacteroidales bacterium]|nr:(4Fe-4S)-binding protein [Bacteroidales bacterium]
MIEDRDGKNNREYTNGEITVYWKPSKCIHVTTCYRELIDVFNPRKRPWINMQGAPTDEIIRVVEMCPTQAISYAWNSEINRKKKAGKKPVEQQPAEIQAAEVRVMKNGPLLIRGKFKIKDADGNEMSQMKMASFCRCGKSGRMPFCDGTHRKIGFSDDNQ